MEVADDRRLGGVAEDLNSATATGPADAPAATPAVVPASGPAAAPVYGSSNCAIFTVPASTKQPVSGSAFLDNGCCYVMKAY